MSRVPRWPLLLIAVLMVAPLAQTASAQNPAYSLDGRVFPEPMMATSFLQWADFENGLAALDEAYPDFVEVFTIGESVEGRPIYFVEVTNENSAKARDDKLQMGYSASIHANEAAGREGMVRVIEDLVSGTGEIGDLQPMLDDLILNVWFPNPDSWASGDWFTVDPTQVVEGNAPSYYRTNVNNVDLNREFPNPGLIEKDHTPMSEPESKGVVQELRYSGRHANLVAGTDLHGMINSPNMMRAIIPNQDMDFHRMMHAVRYLKDLEDRVNNNEHFAEWNQLADALCMLPPVDPPVEDAAQEHAHDLTPTDTQKTALAAVDDGDGVWTLEEAEAYSKAACTGEVGTPLGGVGHGKPFLWGARWDQIGYTDSGFTSDYLMMSPRSPTGGMGAVGTITEFAYSHQVPNNNYVPKLNDMHVAGVRETVATQMEYTLLLEQPRLVGTGPTAYIVNPERVTSANDPKPYKSESGKAFDLAASDTWFDFDQVPYDVANTDFWADLAKFSDDPLTGIAPADVSADTLAAYDNLVITDATVDLIDAAAVKAWVEGGGNLLLTDKALAWFDHAGLTDDAAYMDTYYLGHSDLQDLTHPLLEGVDWNARQTAEGPPTGHYWGDYPQWHLAADKLGSLDVAVAGTTGGDAATGGDPSLGTATVGSGKVHFIGAMLPQPTQTHADRDDVDHRYGLAPYALTALSYYVAMNALGGSVEWQPRDTPFVPHYAADPLYGMTVEETTAAAEDERAPAPALALVALSLVAAAFAVRRARRA